MKFLAAILLLGFVTNVFAQCPRPELGETCADCPWADIARRLQQAEASGQPLAEILAESAPRLDSDLQTDAFSPDLKSLWGYAINFDELAKGQIVLPAIADALLQKFNGPARV